MILGASFDTPEENRAFKEKFGFPYDLLCDVDRSVGIAYGAAESTDAGYASRVSCLIDPEGRIARVYGKVTPADHPGEVLNDIG